MPVSISPVLSMSRAQLDALYRSSPAGTIPNGAGKGTALLAPGTPLTRVGAWIIRLLYWQGKIFDAHRGELRNSISFFRVSAVKAKVYRGVSLLDGKESIILDYSQTSLLARWVRDEIREVEPGVYLGLAYAFNVRLIMFALVFSDPSRP